MRRFSVLFHLLCLFSISFQTVRAQTRGLGAGALVLDDYNGHIVTLQAPIYQTPEWFAWQASTPPFIPLTWSVPVPPANDAQAGFLFTGPFTAYTSIQIPYWLAPHQASISGDGNTGGYAGAYDIASLAQLGIVTGKGTANTVSKWVTADSLSNSSITDNGATVATNEAVSLGSTLGVTGLTTTNGISNTGNVGTVTLSTSGLATLNSASVTTTLGVGGTTTTNGISNSGNIGTGTLAATSTVDANTGFLFNNTGPSRYFLRGNGTDFVADTIHASDLPQGLYINNNTILQTPGNFNISGNGVIGGTLGVSDSATLSGGLKSLGENTFDQGSGGASDFLLVNQQSQFSQFGEFYGNNGLNVGLSALGLWVVQPNSSTSPIMSVYATGVSGSSLDHNTQFINFYDGSDALRGSIKGQNHDDLVNDPVYLANQANFITNTVATAITIFNAVATGVLMILFAIDIAVDICSLVDIPACLTPVTNIVGGIFNLILAVSQLDVVITSMVVYVEEYQIQVANLGVQYTSGSADYAEYLKLENPNDRFYPGDIVGVRNGIISKNTEGAQSILSISMAPIVVGNEPPKGEEANYAKVGFLGQVPARVQGNVHPGDFIMASGLNDGIGIAVSPDQLTPKEFTTVLGRAWTGSENAGIGIVNVAIGLGAKDMSEIVSREEAQIDSLKRESDDEHASTDARFNKLEMALAEPDQAKRQVLLSQAKQLTPRSQPEAIKQSTLPTKPQTSPKASSKSDQIGNTTLIANAEIKALAQTSQPPSAIYDKITKAPSFLAVKKVMDDNIRQIVESSDSPKRKGERVKQYLLNPDVATRRAIGTCAVETWPLVKSFAPSRAAQAQFGEIGDNKNAK